MALKVGDNAPDFELDSDKAGKVSLASLRGKKVVLFFYPKDDTPGCTKESCEFRDLTGNFEAKNTLIFGISADDVASHQAFAKKFDLNYPLLSDPSHKTCQAYGVWGEQSWQGKTFMGISRTTFLIDEQGTIKKIYQNVDPSNHAEQVLNELG